MLTINQQNQVQSLVESLIDKCNSILVETENKESLEYSTVSYNLKGKTAGIAIYGRNIIKLNKVLITENFEYFLADTIPHEVAHIVTAHFFGYQKRHHGKVWKFIMQNIFGIKASRCHDLDTSNSIGRNVKKFEYKCECQKQLISAIKHNKIIKGENHICIKCKSIVTFTGYQTDTKTIMAQHKNK